jgi:diguanylate cyclase (GGDEF)-like protein
LQATTTRIAVDEEEYLLTHLEDTTLRRVEQQRLHRLATHDDLTGLANRTLLAERLDDALADAGRTGRAAGVLYADLDGFKAINDDYGHQAGDELLIVVAERLSRVMRAQDVAGRLGGDEFLIVAGNLGDALALAEISRRVEATLDRPLMVRGVSLQVTMSLGAVLSRSGEDADGVIQRADAAMFEAKRARRRGGLHVVRERVNGAPDVVIVDPPSDVVAVDRPAVDRPAGDRPAADRPAADRPAADRPAVVELTRFEQPALATGERDPWA